MADPKPQLKKTRTLYVEPPLLSPGTKASYKEMVFSEPEDVDEYPLDEIVGEYSDENDRKRYFGRFKDGIIRAYPAKRVRKTHSDILEIYETKKANGELADFDPTTDKQIHPQHRVSIKMKMDLKRKRVTSLSIASPSSSRYADSDEAEVSSDEAASSAYDSVAPSRTTRSKFLSPRKTRSRRVTTFEEEDDDDDEPLALRRSSRRKTWPHIDPDDSSYLGEVDDDDDEESVNKKSKGKKKDQTEKKAKTVPAAYGQFRAVEDVLVNDIDPLLAHRPFCEKCLQIPAHRQLASFKKRKGKRKARRDEDEESSDGEESILAKGGWVRCLKCPVTAHWGCLAKTQREEILKATRLRDRDEWMKAREEAGDETLEFPLASSKRETLEIDESTEFICGSCMKGGICMGCMELAVEPHTSESAVESRPSDNSPSVEKPVENHEGSDANLLFRCLTCKRLAHYHHLYKDLDKEDDVANIAHTHQSNWLCPDCASYQWKLDKIIAWRPYPPNATEPPRAQDEPVNYKSNLPREYLVKWAERGYKRTEWVPHMWLLSTSSQKLRNFLLEGPKVHLLAEPRNGESEASPNPDAPAFATEPNSRASSVQPGTRTPRAPTTALPDAKERIPLPWMTIDRVLEVQLKRPSPSNNRKKSQSRRKVIESEEEDEEGNEVYEAAYERSEEPTGAVESVDDFEKRVRRSFEVDDIDLVIWGLFKWQDLGYDEATPDSPPRPDDETYPAFRAALVRYIAARRVVIPRPTVFDKSEYGKLNRQKDGFRLHHTLKSAEDLNLAQDPKLKLMPFQVDGFNWLCDNWWNQQACILADEMGLGKTVQITSFLGKIITSFNASPALVVVPNSTITNWIREFERWAPDLRVVPFYGEAKSREMIKTFELFHENANAQKTGMKAKFHVLVSTYEAVTHKTDFTAVFKGQPRWEVLVIDEGQRLKSDTSLLFKKLNELNTGHRIIMTGTPLNNNIRELFNLMNFLDPDKWNDLQALEKEHEELTEDLVKQLHVKLRPYFLRRIKSEVLELPPKNEVIVPISMVPLQKQVYRSILSHNADLLSGLTTSASSSGNAGGGHKTINNMLMQLRKCLQHPYTYDPDLEPKNLTPQETHEKLIDGSAKLRFLRTLLPKLKNRGHRVLLFSQFVLALDIIEDFLVGEGIKFLRLDGSTASHARQKGMDEFNRPGSDTFIYLLTTRAGGVGINLFTADTVIIFDPDFNPHQDLQAIARAHRYGQQKPVLVFKLMVKQSAEERIVQVGKKKMVLDHLIVQKMEDDADAGADVQSILMYGAQALFDEGEASSKDIVYSDSDIDKLIEKTEKEGDAEEVQREGANSFSFAKIWTSDKDQMEEVRDENQADSWALTLQKITLEMDLAKAKEEAQFGRGARRKAAAAISKDMYIDGTPIAKSKKKSAASLIHHSDDGSVYDVSEGAAGSDSDSEDDEYEEKIRSTVNNSTAIPGLGLVLEDLNEPCGLCGQNHGDDGDCAMTERSENLAEFREMLILNGGDEPWEERIAAIRVIEETLMKRGELHLIRGQPLHPVPPRPPRPSIEHQQQAKPQTSSAKTTMKRSLSPSRENPAKKMKQQPQQSNVFSCPVCGTAPLHRLEHCPVVTLGPQSVLSAITRLKDVPGMSEVTSMLRRYLEAQRRPVQPGPSKPFVQHEVIELD